MCLNLFKAIGAVVEFVGNVSFTNNNAEGYDGGALYMLTSSQITLNTGAHLEFVNNTGGYDVCICVCVCARSHVHAWAKTLICIFYIASHKLL